MCDDRSDWYASDTRHLTPQQWAALRERIFARAREERRQAVRQTGLAARRAIRRVWRLTHCLVDTLQNAFRRHLAKRKRLQDLRELSAMNTLELKDIGLSRPDVRAAMRSRAKCLPRSD